MQRQRIGIVGIGLMGGSLSLALKQSSQEYYFLALDHNAMHAKEALSLGLVDEVVHTLDEIRSCDIIILTIPVEGIIATIKKLHPLKSHCTVIDFGSTKEKISQSIPDNIRHNFVTAHPMTGTEKHGPSAAFYRLYKDKTVVLCDIEKSGKHQRDVAKKLFLNLGMRLVYMNAKEHDRHAAFISHMPHAVSYALANSVMKQEDNESIIALAGGGFKDMSRIAKSSPDMWGDIFRQNKDNLLQAIYAFESALKSCRLMVENDEWDKLNLWMKEANTLHDILD